MDKFDRKRYLIKELFRVNVNKAGLTYVFKYGIDTQTGYRFWQFFPGSITKTGAFKWLEKWVPKLLWVQKKRPEYQQKEAIEKEEVSEVLKAIRDEIDNVLTTCKDDAGIERALGMDYFTEEE